MRSVMTLLIVLVCCLPTTAQEKTSWGATVVQPPTTETSEVTSSNAAPPRKMGDLTWRQRRKLGLTFRNVLRATRDLHKAGELEGVSQSEVAAMVLDSLVRENPTAFLGDPTFDWDAFLEFIERLLPLILQLIDLFSENFDTTPLTIYAIDTVTHTPTSLAA